MKSLIATLSLLMLFSCAKKNDDSKVSTLYLESSAKIKGMDPIYSSDTYSTRQVGRIYEGLLQFHYLKRPYKLIPALAESLPTVSKDGLIYTFKIKKGIMFQDDKAFKDGKGRELVAEDFVYSIKRLADPKLSSDGWWLLDGKIAGLNQWRDRNAAKDKVDYSEVIDGLKSLDKHTLQFKIVKQFPQFQYALAMSYTFAVAKEVVEHYGVDFINHPVGTGPFTLKEFKQTNKIVFNKNPSFRDEFYPTEGSAEDKANGYLKDAGKKLPLVDRIVVNVIVESQPRMQNLEKGKLDYIGIPKDNFDAVVAPTGAITESYAKKNIQLNISPDLDVTYIAFNHENELLQNTKLRRAMSLAYNGVEALSLFYNNTGIVAQSVIPPGIAGYDANYKNPYKQFSLENAKKMLADAGYPEGKGLPVITYDFKADTVGRQMGEFFQKSMAKIGIKIKLNGNTWPELMKRVRTKQAMTWGIAWVGDYPDAENFLQLVYGPNKSPGANGSNYDNPAVNALYAKASVMQDSAERTALYEKLMKMVAEEVPWIFGVHRQSFEIQHKWLKNYKFSTFPYVNSKYWRIDYAQKKEDLKKL